MMLTALVPGGAQSVTGIHRLGRIGLTVTLINWTIIILANLGLIIARDFTVSLAFNQYAQSIGIFYLAAISGGWFILWLDTAPLITFVKLKPSARPILSCLTRAHLGMTFGGAAYGAYLLSFWASSLGAI